MGLTRFLHAVVFFVLSDIGLSLLLGIYAGLFSYAVTQLGGGGHGMGVASRTPNIYEELAHVLIYSRLCALYMFRRLFAFASAFLACYLIVYARESGFLLASSMAGVPRCLGVFSRVYTPVCLAVAVSVLGSLLGLLFYDIGILVHLAPRAVTILALAAAISSLTLSVGVFASSFFREFGKGFVASFLACFLTEELASPLLKPPVPLLTPTTTYLLKLIATTVGSLVFLALWLLGFCKRFDLR